MSSRPVLDVSELRAGYGSTEVLHGVDLRVAAGTVVALLGPNGAGKTTLLQAIAGLLPCYGGSISLVGSRIERASAHERAGAGVCLIPEGRGTFARLTVRENLAMQARWRDVDRAVERAVEMFPALSSRLRAEAGTLSGGQQQMLALARAFVTEPSIVLADELSAGLAPIVLDDIFDAVRTLKNRGLPLVIVEQHVDRALEIADVVCLLHKGQVVLSGRASECSSDEAFAHYLGGVE
jgi:branched-chain amino acid transport system ATP-binding protein